MTLVRRHPTAVFFVLSFVIAWGFLPFGSFGAFAPLVAALVVVPMSRGRAGLREWGSRLVRWRVRWYWYAAAVGVPLAIHLATGLLTLPSAGSPSPLPFGAYLMAFGVRLVDPTDGPWGEEPGWRGFALAGFQARLTPFAATGVLAAVISVWHAPLVLLAPGGFDPALLLSVVLATTAVTFWYSWLFNHTGGSVLLVVIAHALEGSVQWADDHLTYMAVWVVVAIALVILDRESWRGAAPVGATTAWTAPARGPGAPMAPA